MLRTVVNLRRPSKTSASTNTLTTILQTEQTISPSPTEESTTKERERIKTTMTSTPENKKIAIKGGCHCGYVLDHCFPQLTKSKSD